MADEPDTLIDVEEALVSYYDRILNYVRFKTNMQDAEDIAQLVCLRAISALRRGNGAVQHTSGWLWRITNTTIIDYFRKRGGCAGFVFACGEAWISRIVYRVEVWRQQADGGTDEVATPSQG